jgi:hypothetical protein
MVAELDHAKAERAAAPGRQPTSGPSPDELDRLGGSYADALDVAMERAPYRAGDGGGRRNLLSELAERLGAAGATPRDVVEMHMRVMDDRYAQTHPDRRAAYLDEGRVALVEVLGRLASYYRDRYLSSGGDEQRTAGRP